MGTPEEVARAVVFLASPAASLITDAHDFYNPLPATTDRISQFT